MAQATSATTGTTTGTSSGKVLAILGFVFGAVAILFLPILFGPAGIICSAISMSKREPLGKPALIFSIAATILGFILGAVVFAASNS